MTLEEVPIVIARYLPIRPNCIYRHYIKCMRNNHVTLHDKNSSRTCLGYYESQRSTEIYGNDNFHAVHHIPRFRLMSKH